MTRTLPFKVSLSGLQNSDVMNAVNIKDFDYSESEKAHPGIMMALGFGGFLTLVWSMFVAWQTVQLALFLIHSII
jgi:hypothetical protein